MTRKIEIYTNVDCLSKRFCSTAGIYIGIVRRLDSSCLENLKNLDQLTLTWYHKNHYQPNRAVPTASEHSHQQKVVLNSEKQTNSSDYGCMKINKMIDPEK